MDDPPRDARWDRRPTRPRQEPVAGGSPPRRHGDRPRQGAGPADPRRRQPQAHPARRRPFRGAKIALALFSVLVLGFTGYGWAAMQGLVDGVQFADVIGAEGGGDKPKDGARDILLVGMDSRTDAQGNPLPEEVLAQLRAGDAEGERNTDTLIFVHIPNDGSKAVAFSLPRDSYVDIPGFGQGKINSAYPQAKLAALENLKADGVTDPKELEVRSNHEGARTLVRTVEELTGFTVDHYASINLLGFAEITKAVGGVEVCLRNPVNDWYSGANFDAGPQTISGADALAFVRQRHGLPQGDLDRVRRQQVFMAGLARKVISAGTLTDPGKLNSLTDAITKSVVLSKGWNILEFAKQMQGLTGGQIEFRTIPAEDIEYRTPDGQAAIKVDPEQVRAFIQQVGGGAPPPAQRPAQPAQNPSSITVDVRNGNGVPGLAGTVSQNLAGKGFTPGQVGNTATRAQTVVRVPAGAQAAGTQVADALGAGSVEVRQSPSVPAGHATVLLGNDYAQSSAGAGPSQGQGGSGAPAATQPPPPTQQEPPIKAEGLVCVN